MLGPQSLTEEATDMQDCTMLFRPSLSSTALSLTVGLCSNLAYFFATCSEHDQASQTGGAELSTTSNPVKLRQLYDCVIRPGKLRFIIAWKAIMAV